MWIEVRHLLIGAGLFCVLQQQIGFPYFWGKVIEKQRL
uniref:Uncharacterized protein n=1 Tax=Siphoviridae sp. ctHOG1 TaxID=2827829 RepID=A0A8S5SVI8_9CAUD|nr:MAG TPA: hypothetical protein [Siphoviridae sp. ctHOG1]